MILYLVIQPKNCNCSTTKRYFAIENIGIESSNIKDGGNALHNFNNSVKIINNR